MLIKIRKKAQKMLKVFVALMVLCVVSGYASAEIIDDISLRTDANGDVDAIIKFTVPVQYLRHFPKQKSPYFGIYFNILHTVPRDQWQDYESHRSPPSDIILGFTVTTRDLNTGPKIEVQFKRPAEFSVTEGKSGQSILIHIKPDKPQGMKEVNPVPVASIGVTPLPIAPPVIAPVPALPAAVPGTATPIVVTPKAALAPAVAPAPLVAAPALPPAAPAQALVTPGDQLKSTVAQQSKGTSKIVHIPLGGKDGLPPFPELELVVQEAENVPPSESPSLADQIGKANSQAALLMEKGGNALLAGEPFLAVDAFNNVLKLPLNKYSADAQLWIGIAREKSGQLAKAVSEFESYLKLYPDGMATIWAKARLAKLKVILPAPTAKQQAVPVKEQSTAFQFTEYGSYSMYYYHGASHTDTIQTVGVVQTPSSLSVTDQSSLINNISATARFYNNEFDNRMVFQDFYSANFLPNQHNINRLNAIYFETKNRIVNYSARFGRQSATGGGVLGRFDGVFAGYGFSPDWRINAVAGRLADKTIGSQPVFYGSSLDFGIKDPVGGSLYMINQTVGGMPDRKAMGGNLRYFDPSKTAIAMFDYDIPFATLNMLTIQGTMNSGSGTDYNFLLDSRRSPSLSIRNAVNGTASSINVLMQNGWTQSDLIALAKSRTAISNVGQFGITKHISDKWQNSNDLMVSNTSGMAASGTLNPDGTTGLEGYVSATPSSGNAWTISERLIGNSVIYSRDVTMFSLSYTKSKLMSGETLLLNNHAYFRDMWTFDTTLRLYLQTDTLGGKQTVTAPTIKLGYKVKESLTVETEWGVEMTKATAPSALQSSKTNRKYFTMGFRWDF